VFKDTDNTDLVAWRDNRGVCARNNQEAAKQEIHIDDEYLPDDEVEKLFQGYENRLPKKERQDAREAFDKLDLKSGVKWYRYYLTRAFMNSR